ncbi:aldo/keto reductase [Ornithinimicrobium cryptoxanthini]|uniref:Aldo/keto reductase n=1 Tax=Ornithinimicrobium cryptoxanthini TaxID=2934161 RepID=A0ABY4YH76_9MICO|nr:aldo/keto reductase [Ornithinimicrobium cryptoxanthini]USQ75876.1 aldo/keto reductase [Ornithinimicrobium cryptoxanthini]
MTNSTIPSIELNNGVTIPQVGFGVFQVPEETTQQVVEQALEAGYRHIDTAAAYYNEAGVGAAIRASGLPREDIFVTTKLRNGDQGAETALAAFENSRKALGLDVVDLYLVHWPFPSADKYVETWKSFEKLYEQGAVRAIGVSNFLPQFLERLLAETEVVPAVNQVELHPTFQQTHTQDASRAAGIAVEAYSPLGQGKDLSTPAVTAIAERLGVSTGQVVLRWHVQQGTIVIPKSVTPERIASNLDLFSFELTDEDMGAISALDSDEFIGADPATAAFTQVRA